MDESKMLEKMHSLPGWCLTDKALKLYNLVLKHRPKVIVEIGVFGGRSLMVMAEAAQITNSTVIGIDPYCEEEVQQYNLDGSKILHDPIDWAFVKKSAYDAIASYKDVAILDITSEEGFSAYPYAEVNMIHIDGNHSKEAVLKDLNMWSRKLAKDALVLLDDTNWETVQAAVKEYGKLTLVEDFTTWSLYKHD